ncbi:HD domain-containing protein [bacterium]|nr:HD domain-containing protein [candidate division CSSED10-310 bacterium]
MKTVKNIRDSVHGDLPFTALELRLMDTGVMQRLRGIRQLGTSHLVYPGASHTRFDHSLGTNFMAKRILERLTREQGLRMDTREWEAVCVSALIHDITHLPFGHTLEDERRIFPRHDEDENRVRHFIQNGEIGSILNRESLLEEVLSLLKSRELPHGEKAYPRQIVSHTICADLLDYIRRDARNCGLIMDFDDRILRYFQIENDRLILNLQQNGLFRHDAFSEVIHLLRIRYFLTERVYYHHAKIAAGAMISRAVERAVELGFEIGQLYHLGDEALLYALNETYRADKAIRRLLGKYRSRNLYKRVYVLTDLNIDPETRAEFAEKYHLNSKGDRGSAEKRIARDARIPHEAVIVYAPPPQMNLKEANVLVKVDQNPARPLHVYKNREVLSLQEKYGRLWKFYVFIDPEYNQRFTAAAGACERLFGFKNDLPLIRKGQLSLFPGQSDTQYRT